MRRFAIGITAAALVAVTTWLVSAEQSARLIIPESDIIFSHELHVGEMEVECITCHPEIASSSRADDRNLPTMDDCAECHDDVIEDDEECGMCHRDSDDPLELPNPPRPISFSHQAHLIRELDCTDCHGDVGGSARLTEAHFPTMAQCFTCHDGYKADEECALCHGDRLTLADIHPEDWRHQHGDRAAINPEWCAGCHPQESECLRCHTGDNLTGNIHDLNYRLTHGLDARGTESDCRRCHDVKAFCNDCHRSELRMPLNHSAIAWVRDHGDAARDDVENCASCHDSADPTCARSGCHADFDGLRGTDNRFHGSGGGLFDSEGGWHDDPGDFCYQCHVNTRTPGSGFCGYCHD